MKITLTQEERLNILHSTLCNVGHFYYGVMSYFSKHNAPYNKAKELLIKNDVVVCREDIMTQIVHSGGIIVIQDHEDGKE